MARAIFVVLLLVIFAPAQHVLMPVFDAQLPGNSDNSTLIVIQPSRHNDVIIYPLFAGENAWQAVPVISLYGRYGMNNLSMETTFASMHLTEHLMWPNPISLVQPWLLTVGPLSATQLTAWTPILYSHSLFDELSYAFNMAGVLNLGGGQYLSSFSNGGFAVNTEGIGSGLSSTPTIGPARLGEAMCAADLNGDGIDDLAVGAPNDIGGGLVGAGRVYVYVGIPGQGTFSGGLHPVPYVIEEPNMALLPLAFGENPGPEHNARFGATLDAGDLDGDGIDELVVGVPRGDANSGEPDPGEAYVYLRLDTLLTANPPPSTPVLLNVSPTDITQPEPNTERAHALFGMRIACGDLNGDQIDDLVVSSPMLDNSPLASDQEVGGVYVFLGPLGGQTFIQEDALLQDPIPAAGKRFGSALVVTNMDADPSEEILIGVPGQQVQGMGNAGKIAIWSFAMGGSTQDQAIDHPAPVGLADLGTSIGVGDIDGDGVLDIVAGSNEDVLVGAGPTTPGTTASNAGITYVFRGPSYSTNAEDLTTPVTPADFDRFGSALLVDDLNADGIDDIVVAAPGRVTDGMALAGQVFVYFGGATSSLDDSFRRLHLKSDAPAAYSLLGMTLAAGDFSGAGVNDLVCSEPLAGGPGGPGNGRVVVYTDLLHRKDNLTRPEILNGVAPNQ